MKRYSIRNRLPKTADIVSPRSFRVSGSSRVSRTKGLPFGTSRSSRSVSRPAGRTSAKTEANRLRPFSRATAVSHPARSSSTRAAGPHRFRSFGYRVGRLRLCSLHGGPSGCDPRIVRRGAGRGGHLPIKKRQGGWPTRRRGPCEPTLQRGQVVHDRLQTRQAADLREADQRHLQDQARFGCTAHLALGLLYALDHRLQLHKRGLFGLAATDRDVHPRPLQEGARLRADLEDG